MVILATGALILGVICGMTIPDHALLRFISGHSTAILYALMFSVGISLGLNRGLIRKMREHQNMILTIPFGTVIGSIAGGILCSRLTGIPQNISTAMACGLGWYSLSSVTIGKLVGVQMGSITFLSNLLREIFSFFSIPFIAKNLNYYSCIASAGATSEDTTLPMMIKYTNEETVVVSVLNGIICSALVPFLISFCYRIF